MWLWVALCFAGAARAQSSDPILVLQDASQPRPALVSSLRIQLMDATPVGTREWRAVGTLGERIQAASEIARAEQALAVVWAEPPLRLPGGGLEAVLYIVARSGDRAALEVVRVPGERGPDLDRTLALKVEEVVEQLRRSDTTLAAAALTASPPLTAAARELPAAAPAAATRWGSSLAAGARLSSSGFTRWGVGVEAGPTLQLDTWLLASTLGLDWLPPASQSLAGRSVSLDQLTAQLTASARWRADGFGVGGRLGTGLAFVDAHGETELHRLGNARSQTVALFAGVVVERALVHGLILALELGIQVNALRQRFEVNRATLVDLGRVAGIAGINLEWCSP